MKKIFFIGCAVCIMLGTGACRPKEQGNIVSSSKIYSGPDNSENSVDWDGVYNGVIPCADCPGIQVQITLSPDNTYKMNYLYMSREPFEKKYKGSFKWSMDGGSITLDNEDKTSFIVGENLIIQLDTNGKIITGELADSYILVKVDTRLTDKRWKLTEFKGNPVTAAGTKSAYITFNSKDTRVFGNSDCNSFSGTYQLKRANRLLFSETVFTQKMCTNMDIENKLREVFRTVESYTIERNTLILHSKETTPLARFTAE
ncbi:MAG: META domain-containing protein [Prevotellaceae bacterium]|jgi:heat shock protein HslJ|nr:META domain-containing protein [Prevotellaceae bacterium]